MAPTDPAYDEKNDGLKLVTEVDSSTGNVETTGVTAERTLHRQLKNRHIAMIRCLSFLIPKKSLSHIFSSSVSVVSLERVFSLAQQIHSRLAVPSAFCLVTLSLVLYAIALWYSRTVFAG